MIGDWYQHHKMEVYTYMILRMVNYCVKEHTNLERVVRLKWKNKNKDYGEF